MTEGGAAADEALASGAGNQAALRTGAVSIAVDSAVEAIPIGAVADVLIKRFKRFKRVGSEVAQAAAKNVDELSEAATKAVDDGVSIKGGSGALEGPGKIPKPGDSDFMGPLTKSEQHFIYGDGIGSKKKGVLGAHNLESFDNTLKSTGYSLEDLKVGAPIPHPTVDGVYAQYYRVPAYDGSGNFIGFKDIPDPKTYYDPGIISNSQMLQWGKEAMNNTNPIGDGGYLIKGTASNGLEFYGYLRDGEITNFFPSVPK